MLNGENLEAFSPKSGARQGCLTLFQLLFNHSPCKVLDRAVRQKKEIQLRIMGKGEVRGCFGLFIKVSDMEKCV